MGHFDGVLIPIVAIVMVFSPPIVAIIAIYLVKRKNAEVRMKAIEKGVPLPVDASESLNPYERMARSRRKGIAWTMGGLGIFASFAVMAIASGNPDFVVFGALGLIPLFIGIGLFIDASLRRRDLDKGEAPRPQDSSPEATIS